MHIHGKYVEPVNRHIEIVIDGSEEGDIQDILHIPWMPIEGVLKDELEILKYKSIFVFTYQLVSVDRHSVSVPDSLSDRHWLNKLSLTYKLVGVKTD